MNDIETNPNVFFYGTSPQFLALTDPASASEKVDVYKHTSAFRANALESMPLTPNVVVFEMDSTFDELEFERLQKSLPEIRLIGANLSTSQLTLFRHNERLVLPIAALSYELNIRISTHKFLTRQGFEILRHDQGSSFIAAIINAEGENSIVDWSVWPDYNEEDLITYRGHFYSPETGKNYKGDTDPTALTRFVYYYDKAIKNFPNKIPGIWQKSLACALHYFQDATAPFHVANDPVQLFTDWDHSHFEDLAEKCCDSYKIQSSDVYGAMRRLNKDAILRQAAFDALITYRKYNLGDTDAHWKEGIEEGLKFAQRWTPGILYLFILDAKNRLPK